MNVLGQRSKPRSQWRVCGGILVGSVWSQVRVVAMGFLHCDLLGGVDTVCLVLGSPAVLEQKDNKSEGGSFGFFKFPWKGYLSRPFLNQRM